MNLEAQLRESLLSLAIESQVLMFGEVHGTQEVPDLISTLLDDLQANDFGILGLELPHAEQDQLRKWALQETSQPPAFFTHPSGDGRGNEQVLELVRQAVRMKWWVVCFDGFDPAGGTWQQRDRAMAEILIQEWDQSFPYKKAICVCGNMHSRLTQTADMGKQYWPSFAANLRSIKPHVKVTSINVVFHHGAFFNIKVRKIHGHTIYEPYISNDGSDGHSASLHFPVATPATHLTKPPSGFLQLLRVAPMMAINLARRYKLRQ